MIEKEYDFNPNFTLVFLQSENTGNAGRGKCALTLFVVLQETMASPSLEAFGVFLDHWMIDENRAKRRDYFQKMRLRINGPLVSRYLVDRFFEMFEIYEMALGQGDQDPNLFHQIQNSAMMLIVIRAVGGVCRACGQSCLRFEIHQRDDFILVCQNERCRDVDFYVIDLFR